MSDLEIALRALRSIAANTCCDTCREASLVAKGALKELEAREEKNRLQKLVDICFSLAIMVHCDERFAKRDREGVAKYVADQLRECGFPTHPVGMSWGVLEAIPQTAKPCYPYPNTMGRT